MLVLSPKGLQRCVSLLVIFYPLCKSCQGTPRSGFWGSSLPRITSSWPSRACFTLACLPMQETEEMQGSILGLGRSPGRGHVNSFQYSCLENLTDRGACAMVYEITKSQTWLKQLRMHAHIRISTQWDRYRYFLSLTERRREIREIGGKFWWKTRWRKEEVDGSGWLTDSASVYKEILRELGTRGKA